MQKWLLIILSPDVMIINYIYYLPSFDIQMLVFRVVAAFLVFRLDPAILSLATNDSTLVEYFVDVFWQIVQFLHHFP